jgi:hypothetical protein
MNIKKAIGAGLLVFAIQYAAVSVIGNTIGPLLVGGKYVEYIWQGIMAILLVGIVCRTTKWYFKDNTSNWINGLYVGLVFVVTSFMINLLQAIPALVAGQDVLGPIISYVSSVSFWITVSITVAAATMSGYINGRCTTCTTTE